MRVVLHAGLSCAESDLIRAALTQQGIECDEIITDNVEVRERILDRLELVGEKRSLPQVVVTNHFGQPHVFGGISNLSNIIMAAKYPFYW